MGKGGTTHEEDHRRGHLNRASRRGNIGEHDVRQLL